jgi:TonB family protein
VFEELRPLSRGRLQRALLASLALHIVGIWVLAWHPAAKRVLIHEVALGSAYSSGSVIYLAPLGREQTRDTKQLEVAKIKEPKPTVPPAPKKIAAQREAASQTTDNAAEVTARAGSPYGSHVPGTPFGPAVMPALPQVFPDPPVSRSDIPFGVEGDVIAEVTIDEQGNVTDVKLTHGIGYGVDEKVMTVLHKWHFRPATRDGISIASQQIVRYHYPS